MICIMVSLLEELLQSPTSCCCFRNRCSHPSTALDNITANEPVALGWRKSLYGMWHKNPRLCTPDVNPPTTLILGRLIQLPFRQGEYVLQWAQRRPQGQDISWWFGCTMRPVAYLPGGSDRGSRRIWVSLLEELLRPLKHSAFGSR